MCLTAGSRQIGLDCISLLYNAFGRGGHQSPKYSTFISEARNRCGKACVLVGRGIQSGRNALSFVDRVYAPPHDLRHIRQLRCAKTHLDAKSANKRTT